MQNFIQNKKILIPAAVGLSLLFSGAVFANDDLRNGIVTVQSGAEISTAPVSDELIEANLEQFDFDLEIVRIERTEKDIRVVYQFETMIKTEGVWSQNRNEEVLIIKNERIEDEKQLKAFVNNELLEVVEQERMYLKRLQSREQEVRDAQKNQANVVEVSVLNGLFELTFDARIELDEEEKLLNDQDGEQVEEAELKPLAGISRSLPAEEATEILVQPGRLGNGDDTYTLEEWIEDLEEAETDEEIDEVLETDPEDLPSDFEENEEVDGEQEEIATSTELEVNTDEETTSTSTDSNTVEQEEESTTSTTETAIENSPTSTQESTENEEVTSTTTTDTEEISSEETEEEQSQGNIIVTTGENEDEEVVVVTEESPEEQEEAVEPEVEEIEDGEQVQPSGEPEVIEDEDDEDTETPEESNAA